MCSMLHYKMFKDVNCTLNKCERFCMSGGGEEWLLLITSFYTCDIAIASVQFMTVVIYCFRL